MPKRDSLQRNLLAMYLLQVANVAIPMLTLPYLVRVVGVERFGLIALAQAVVQYFVFTIDSGFNNSAAREIAAHRDRPGAVLEVYWATQSIRGVVLLMASAFFLLLVLAVPAMTAHWQLYLLSFTAAWGSFLFAPWLYQGLERMRFTAILQVTGRIVAAVALVLLVRGPGDFVLAAAIQAGALLVSGLLGLVVCFWSGMLRWQRPTSAAIWRTLRLGRHLYWSELLSNAFSSSGVLLLGVTATSHVVGAYAAAEKLIRAAQMGYAPISQALLPRAVALLSSDERRDAAWHRLTHVAVAALIVAIGGAAVVSIFAGDILALLFGRSLSGHGELLALMVWILPVNATNLVLGQLFVFAAGHRNDYAYAIGLGAAVQGMLSLALVLPLGAPGIVAALLIGDLCTTMMLARWMVRSRRQRPGGVPGPVAPARQREAAA
jgi:PST family polysaccharide transporter